MGEEQDRVGRVGMAAIADELLGLHERLVVDQKLPLRDVVAPRIRMGQPLDREGLVEEDPRRIRVGEELFPNGREIPVASLGQPPAFLGELGSMAFVDTFQDLGGLKQLPGIGDGGLIICQEQQDADEFQCYKWARDESGFDPMATPTATEPPPPQEATSPPPRAR